MSESTTAEDPQPSKDEDVTEPAQENVEPSTDATEAPRPTTPPIVDPEPVNSTSNQETTSNADPGETKTPSESPPKSDPKTSAKKPYRRPPFGGRLPYPHFPPYYYMNSAPYGTAASSMSYYGFPYDFSYGSPYSSPYVSPGTRYMDGREPIWYPDSLTLPRSMTDHPMLNRQVSMSNWPTQEPYAPYEFETSSLVPIANSQYPFTDYPYSAANRPNSFKNRPHSYTDQALSARAPRKTRFQIDNIKRNDDDGEYGGNEDYFYRDEIEVKPTKHAPSRKSDSSKKQKKTLLAPEVPKRADKLRRQRDSLRTPSAAGSSPATRADVDTFNKSSARTIHKAGNEEFDFEEPLHGQGELRLPPVASSDHTKASSYSHGKASSKGRTTTKRPRATRHVSFEDGSTEYVLRNGRSRTKARETALVPTQGPNNSELSGLNERIDSLGLESNNVAAKDPAQQKAEEYMNEKKTQVAESFSPRLRNRSKLQSLSNRDSAADSDSIHSKRSAHYGGTLVRTRSGKSTSSENGGVMVKSDELKMLIDINEGFEVEFDGRRLGIYPIGEGSVAELIIGGKTENTHPSGRVSTITSQSHERNDSSNEDEDEDENDEEDDGHSNESDSQSSSGSSAAAYVSGRNNLEDQNEYGRTYLNRDQHGINLFGA